MIMSFSRKPTSKGMSTPPPHIKVKVHTVAVLLHVSTLLCNFHPVSRLVRQNHFATLQSNKLICKGCCENNKKIFAGPAYFWNSSEASTIRPHDSSSDEWCSAWTIACSVFPRSPPPLLAPTPDAAISKEHTVTKTTKQQLHLAGIKVRGVACR